ncbi:vWA domain-containing protein [Sulfurospirillum arcachonense]|uniref:vWA domain-containing protein n=1 Tax=Sulfurospirillum arcachonense TaxID=57666 RepID=UPI000469C25D|nr:VWA domain-containing protein [Sulfurospirillum arcachonense]
MEFEYPYVFLILFVFIVSSFIWKPKNAYMYMPNFSKISLHVKRDYFKEVLKWLTLITLIIALASPISKIDRSSTKPAHAVMLLMDVSDSMQGRMIANSFGEVDNKLNIAKRNASKYIKERINDHVGIIVFGDFAYVASPLSFDHESSASLLNNVKRGVAGSKTAMYDALFLSARLLKESKVKEKVVILLTDGFDTASKIPFEAALRAIQSEKLKVFTIGIGRYGDYDERALKIIAQKSGGEFFSVRDSDNLEKIYNYINKLQKSELDEKAQYNTNYLYMYPLSLALLFIFIYIVLYSRGARK